MDERRKVREMYDSAREEEEFQERVLVELSALRAENERMRTKTNEIDSLREEVARLRSAVPEHNRGLELAEQERQDHGRNIGGTAMSRSQFLRLGGAAAAGAVVAGASGLVAPEAADAATGGALIIGQDNRPSSSAHVTTLSNPSGTELSPLLMKVDNYSNTPIGLPADARIAVAGTTSGSDTTNNGRVGVAGLTDSGFSPTYGVLGRAGRTGANPFFINGANGVIGAAVDGGRGVVGLANGEYGQAILGLTDVGVAVEASSETGLCVYARSSGRIRQALRDTAGSPTTGFFSSGEQVRDSDGELWLCVASGEPGTWRRAATVKEGFLGGSVNLLTRPIRIYDSRLTGGMLPAGATRNVPVTEVVAGGLKIPAGARGVLGNITVVSTGASGYLTLFPQGSPPTAANMTASINWFAVNQVLNNAAVVRLNPANGQIGVGNGLGGGSTSTHFVFDATGFVF